MSKEFNHIAISAQNHLLLIVFVFFSLGTISSFSQNCKAELSVEKNRNYKSANENGAEFSLIIKNTSSSAESYNLSAINSKVSCTPKNRSSNLANVTLDVQLPGTNTKSNSANRISVGAGQSQTFKVKVMAPSGTPFETWGCIEVQAKPDSCNEIISTVLSVYVPDPSQG